MKNLQSIWSKPIYLPYLQPKLTDEILVNAEMTLGYKLPKELIELLKMQNGGYLRKTLEESVHEQIYGIGPHFPSLTAVDLTDYEDWVSFELEGLIPFDGDGHWHICLDYRKNKTEPQVTYIRAESDHQEKIADTFADYLSQLVLDVEDELVIRTKNPIEQVIKELEELLNIKFEAADNFAHGYDQYRSLLKDTWIWLNSNHVPNGFIREGEDRYNELIALSKGKALMYPELLKSDILISFSSKKIEMESVEILKKYSIDIKPLIELL